MAESSQRRSDEISIDTQSFVNLGQLMGSGQGAASIGKGTSSSFLSGSDMDSDAEGLRDFDQVFHPTESGLWSNDLDASVPDISRTGSEKDGDDVLPAIPRSPTPVSLAGSDSISTDPEMRMLSDNSPLNLPTDHVWSLDSRPSQATSVAEVSSGGYIRRAAVDFPDDFVQDRSRQMVGTATIPQEDAGHIGAPEQQRINRDGEVGPSTLLSLAQPAGLRGSWLHVSRDISDLERSESEQQNSPGSPGRALDLHEEQNEDAARLNWRRFGDRLGLDMLREHSACIIEDMERAYAAALPRLQHLATMVMIPVEAGVDAYSKALKRGQEAVIRAHHAALKAVDSVPQAPVRMWLARMAGSLVFGAILGAAFVYCASPRGFIGSREPAGDARQSWSYGQGHDLSGTNAELSFGERLNRALFAARAGEAAAQQGLLEEVRNILAATGKSGGISAEQILRQFNAKRFAEASKAWSAADGHVGTDPLYYMPPPAKGSTTSQPQPTSYGKPDVAQGSNTREVPPGNVNGNTHHMNSHSARGFQQNRSNRDGSPSGYDGDSAYTPGMNFPSNAASRPHPRRNCAGGGWIC